MDSTDNDSLHALTDEQIEHLATILVEDFGSGLHRTEFDNVVLLMFEGAAGFEVMTNNSRMLTCVHCGSSTHGSSGRTANTDGWLPP